MGNEVNGVSTRHITDTLCQANKFIGEIFHSDVAVLVHLDEVMKLE